ncbi:MAG: hypothetical protein IPK60_16405 [Sandaracinaceae bacterium]|nr:hypothetical protein [Sandaracinaceae bacterium]
MATMDKRTLQRLILALSVFGVLMSGCQRIKELLNPPPAPTAPPPASTAPPVPVLPPKPQAAGPATLNVTGAPNFGERVIAATFAPDPLTVEVNSGGPFQVREANIGPCTGFVTARPDFNLRVTSAMPFLRIFMEAQAGDTTLIINRPNGTWACADDTYQTNPGLDFENAPPGLYNVWVGSYSAGTQVHGSLTVTASRTRIPGGEMQQLEVNGIPGAGAYELREHFSPNPVRVEAVAGGSIQARTSNPGSLCPGWIALRPDLNFTLAAAESQFRISVAEAESNQDTTLVVIGPDGEWRCNDDTDGNRPALTYPTAPPGMYHVWIGSYVQTEQPDVRVEVSHARIGSSRRPRGRKH